MKFTSDIDIDMADRDSLLKLIEHVPASIRGADVRKHNTGVYVTDVPYDPVNRVCAIDYQEAENRGYVKLDLLNIWVYKWIRDESHLIEMSADPDWSKLNNKEIFENLIHIGKHWETLCAMPEPIDSIEKLAMFLALIRPGKRHLIGKPWSAVAETIWLRGQDGYQFKRSHSIAYAHLVVVNLNLIISGSIGSWSVADSVT